MGNTIGALFVIAILTACRPAVGPLQGIRNPSPDAWPTEPLAVLIVHDPWAMVIGADTPRAELFGDGTVIRLDVSNESRPRLLVSRLTAPELARVKAAIEPSARFWRLNDEYNLQPNVTDLPTTELVIAGGGRFKRVFVYGYAPDAWKPPAYTILPGRSEGDSLPRDVDRICRLLVSLKPANEVAWSPRYMEVMLWPYEHSPDVPMEWPERWPDLSSRMAFARGNSYSLILPGSELPALEAFVAKRGERQAVSLGGKKWSIAYRPVMPGGTWAEKIAAAQ